MENKIQELTDKIYLKAWKKETRKRKDYRECSGRSKKDH